MRVFSLLLSMFCLFTGTRSVAQNRFGLAPQDHTAITFSLSTLKQHKEDISPLMLEALTAPGAPKGLVFVGHGGTQNYEVAILGLKTRITLFQSLPTQIESITCISSNPIGAYFMATKTVGFNVSSKDQDFQFRDQTGRPCYLKASAAFMQNVKLQTSGAMLVITPAYSRGQ